MFQQLRKVIQQNLAHHSYEQSWLLCSPPHACVTDNSDGKTCSETCKTDRETSTELDEASCQSHLRLDCGGRRRFSERGVNWLRIWTYVHQRSSPKRQVRRSDMHASITIDDKSKGRGVRVKGYTYADDTSHNDGHDTLHHLVRPKDGHRRNTDS